MDVTWGGEIDLIFPLAHLILGCYNFGMDLLRGKGLVKFESSSKRSVFTKVYGPCFLFLTRIFDLAGIYNEFHRYLIFLKRTA